VGPMAIRILRTIRTGVTSVRFDSDYSANEVCMDAAVHGVAMGQAKALYCSI